MERLLQDVRFGIRLLWKDRVFAATALLTLALCIGANAAIFAIVNSVLLRPLPVPDAGRLALVYNSYPRAGVERASNGVPDYYDRLKAISAFDEQALYNTRGVTIGLNGEPQRVTMMLARPSLLRMLQARPVRGRIFTEAEGEPGTSNQVLLTYSLWQQMYGGRDSAVGETIRVSGEPNTIVGVLPQDFFFLDPEVKLWKPLSFTPEERSDDARHNNNWSMVGRLRPDASFQQAQQQMDALNAANLDRFPSFREPLVNAGFHTVVTGFQDDLTRAVRSTLFLLWGGVLVVLLIGAVNITNLVLVRSSARLRELATRHALGAALPRLTRQLLTETIMLTVAGGVLGLLLGYGILHGLSSLGIERLPRGTEIRMDGRVALFTLGLAFAIGCLVGLVPVMNVRNMNLNQAFREESRSGTSGRGTRAARRLMVASQVAFAFVLLVGAGLLFASFERVLAVNPGFSPDGVLTARVALPRGRYKDNPASLAFASRLLERVRALPGITQAGLSTTAPFMGNTSDSVILAEGYQMKPGESLVSPFRISADGGYFTALGIPLRRGRLFNDGDTPDSPKVVIVDEPLAKHFWGNTDPIGRRMYLPDGAEDLKAPGPKVRWVTVVGVVGNVRMSGLVATDDRVGAYYFPFTQEPSGNMSLTIKTAGDPIAIVPSIRREVTAIDPELPLYSTRTLDDRMSESLIDRRTPMLLAMAFAGIALFLAAIGIYGVLAYQVAQRTREIGIRMALGSGAPAIFRMVIREGLTLLVAGLAVGAVGAVGLRRAMDAQLYGANGMDVTVLAGVAAVLAIVAIAACAVPARRASRIDPAIALSE